MRVLNSMETATIANSNLNFQTSEKTVFATKLNLVALMDIFTILVFFLLLNSGDANELESAKFVKLPDSSVGTAPHVDASIIIGEESIWLNNEVVVSVEEVLNSGKKSIEPLAEALRVYSEEKGELTSYEKENGLSVTILGDQSVSYSLLESVMATCSENNFREISLAVNRVASQSLLGAQSSVGQPENLGKSGGK